jgi:alpha-amylase
VFDIGQNHDYFDEVKNKEIMKKVAKKCYIPATKLMLKLAKKHKGKFKVSYSITLTALEQMEKWTPEVIKIFKQLAETGCVEFLSETSHHSLAFLYDKEEFVEQVKLHKKKIKALFGVEPKVFRNTELIYNNDLAKTIEGLGYKAILAEGADHILGNKSPNFVYTPHGCKKMKLLLKNYKLSDDIAFRFSEQTWDGWPLNPKKFVDWIEPLQGDSINLFMDYETFGEHQWEDSGIFKFLQQLPDELFKRNMGFKLPSELVKVQGKEVIDMHHPVSWADVERDLSAWLGNKMQHSAMRELYNLLPAVKESKNKELIETWRKLSTSDHFYYMCTKWFADGDVHKYFNPYESPYDGFIAFMNVINDMVDRLEQKSVLKRPEPVKNWIKV